MISGVLPARFRGLFKKKMADSRVQKAIAWLVALKKRKRLSQLRDEARSYFALCTFICTKAAAIRPAKAAAIRPAASYSGPCKSSTLKRGMDASPFFCVV